MNHNDPRIEIIAEILERRCDAPRGRPWMFDVHQIATEILRAIEKKAA